MIETRLLQYFLAVAQEQNITKAAELLHITQPTLSKQLMDLERQIGRPLLIRGSRKTLLTEDGEFLRSKAQEILSLMEKTESEFRNPKKSVSGDIHIGAGEFASLKPFMEEISGLHNQYPELQFHVSSGTAEETMLKLDQGLIDMALVIDPEFSERYEYYRLPYTESWGLLYRNDHPVSQGDFFPIQDLSQISVLVPSRLKRIPSFSELLAYHQIELKETGTFTMIYNGALLVQSGYDPAICLGHLSDQFSQLNWIPFDPPVSTSIYLVLKKYQVQSSASSFFLQHLMQAGLIGNSTLE